MLKNKPALLLLAVLVAVALAYANHFQNGFHFDDAHTVVDNPYIRSLANLPRFFTDPTTFSVLPANRTWRPLVSASLAFDYWLGSGYVPGFFHLSTFLIFLGQLALMAGFFTALLNRVAPDAPERNHFAALFATAWYGLHPAIAETVNYVIQRGDIFAAVGVVAAFFIYVKYPERRRQCLYLIPFALALLCKPPALVFPLLLAAYVYLFEEGENPRRLAASAIKAVPAFIVCVLLLLLQARMTPKSFTPSIISAFSYRMTQPYVWLRYFGALFLPIHLNVDTDLSPFNAVNGPMIAGLFFVALLIGAIWFTAKSKLLRPISFGLFWFCVAQLPTSLYLLSEVENDHRMYLAFVGLVLAVVWTLALLLQLFSVSRKWLTILALVMLGLYAQGTVARNRVWRDDETLWKDDVEKSPHNGRGLMNYGLVLMGRGDGIGAREIFLRALVETPNYAILETNLGIVSNLLGYNAEAERHFARALALTPNADEPRYHYARVLFQQRRLQEAQAQAQSAVQLNPSRLGTQYLLMQIDASLGEDTAAQAVAQDILRIAPGDAAAVRLLAHPGERSVDDWLDMSLRNYQQGKYEDAKNAAREALKQKPDSAIAYNNIAAAAAAEKNWDEAISNAGRALQLKPDFQLAKNNLVWAASEKAKLKPAAP
jgi:tetratricopeptide (TPR) repeat protein